MSIIILKEWPTELERWHWVHTINRDRGNETPLQPHSQTFSKNKNINKQRAQVLTHEGHLARGADRYRSNQSRVMWTPEGCCWFEAEGRGRNTQLRGWRQGVRFDTNCSWIRRLNLNPDTWGLPLFQWPRNKVWSFWCTVEALHSLQCLKQNKNENHFLVVGGLQMVKFWSANSF